MKIICKKCGEYREYKACGLCNNCYMKQWHLKNKKEQKMFKKKYYQKNKEKMKEITRK